MDRKNGILMPNDAWRVALYINEYGSVVHAPGPGIEVVAVMPVSEHEDAIKRLERSLANVDAAIWGGLRMIDGGRPAQGLSLIRSCLPEGYEPYGDPAGQKERNPDA